MVVDSGYLSYYYSLLLTFKTYMEEMVGYNSFTVRNGTTFLANSTAISG